jgi:hypothetical protein
VELPPLVVGKKVVEMPEDVGQRVELPPEVVGQKVVLPPLVVGKNVVEMPEDVGQRVELPGQKVVPPQEVSGQRVHQVVLLPNEVVVRKVSSTYV